ncbi:MAG TPA: glycoside hydrolase family 92 protein, partial [Terracidiphilus sp.]|nr:glycoside hydrolase family 92 protein [Terracidiphilus sp.]
MLGHSRRDFLKASSLVALGTTLVDAGGQEQPDKRAKTELKPAIAPVSSDLAGLVNLFQGTDSDYYFSRGNALPIAAMPFGMAHWTLQSRSGSSWMFQP